MRAFFFLIQKSRGHTNAVALALGHVVGAWLRGAKLSETVNSSTAPPRENGAKRFFALNSVGQLCATCASIF